MFNVSFFYCFYFSIVYYYCGSFWEFVIKEDFKSDMFDNVLFFFNFFRIFFELLSQI